MQFDSLKSPWAMVAAEGGIYVIFNSTVLLTILVDTEVTILEFSEC